MDMLDAAQVVVDNSDLAVNRAEIQTILQLIKEIERLRKRIADQEPSH